MSIRHYPWMLLSLFTMYYAYFASTLYGLYNTSVLVFAVSIIYLNLWFIYRCEIPAYLKQEVRDDAHRAHMVQMAQPAWIGGIPSEISLFHPLTEAPPPERMFRDGGGNMNENDGDDGSLLDLQHVDDLNQAGNDDTAAVNGLSALMQMAGVSFHPSTYTELTTGDDEQNVGSGGGGESKRESKRESKSESKSESIQITMTGGFMSSESEEETSSDDDDNVDLLFRP